MPHDAPAGHALHAEGLQARTRKANGTPGAICS